MFDIPGIMRSAETMANVAQELTSRMESIENLTREQNALLGALLLVDGGALSEEMYETAGRAVQRYINAERSKNGG